MECLFNWLNTNSAAIQAMSAIFIVGLTTALSRYNKAMAKANEDIPRDLLSETNYGATHYKKILLFPNIYRNVQMRIFIFLLLLASFTSYSATANQDVIWICKKDFNNVKIKVYGNNFAVMNKYGIIGSLTKNLCEKYSYYDSVLVDFGLYQNPMLPDYKYLISYDNSCKRYFDRDTKLTQEIETEFTKDFTCIYAPDNDFNPENILKIVEYAILNQHNFDKMRFFEYCTSIEGFYTFAVDTNNIKEILSTPSSPIVK